LSTGLYITGIIISRSNIMAKTYHLTQMRRFANALIKALISAHLAPKQTYLLSVRGRKSGKLYSTPVRLVEEDSQRWLVAPYGEVNWVQNARAAGEVTLTRNGRSEVARLTELGPEESAPVLKRYLEEVPLVRPYFDVRPNAPVQEFISEASRHPVFRI
jgi:deazaflavin-dependent oxidoreductase (nitroreductase family)